ncbi:Lysyl-tRNA synthetase [Candidatus Arthromitus sp. SFB-mouse-Japan]|uniref:lysine--tRNA ligase n=1 Tax=unclassified Candidatus Neoarthromitus TaxID=2638829 RepID=UPI00021B8173|nr:MULTISPECIES: lysine--tRNA ligase [unclassified Candidatus Arthromitus]EIA22595.1 Lysyl-tRNA synthetase [Candidatus Arthromitus sp. SFB-3]EIA29383.1 Lysyl-tRNA synthetase [Candidatus Arthromitus sp. SFB-co]EIA29681.1 Lysyl-tRNA synthetase [Candidatus Arthromitus sp. SFB-mouse-SU]AID45463.1 Lysyl-tRNA synthetase [Candidatus Arthromitus sp. SFB-mouse-NL]EGX28128.1 lysyl-tRNA synthetase [Candidatus Arthromitus sp. SFB-mouse-NYU]
MEFNEQEIIRRNKLSDLQEKGMDPFNVYKVDVSDYSKNIIDNYLDYEGKIVKLAGRIMTKRGQGKAGFITIQDTLGQIQIFIKVDIVGKETLDSVFSYDIGDIIWVEGEVFKTKVGEVTIRVLKIDLISKSLRVLPEKFHGITDPDLRYRHREIDIIMNRDVKDVFLKRSKIISEIRLFLDNRGYLEAETPILSLIAGGAAARPFLTHHNTLNMDMYLRIATELYLKRLIVSGFDKVYEMGKNFRNEGIDIKHNPEFTMIELYEAYSDYNDMMRLTEDLISSVCLKVCGSMKVEYQGTEIDFTPPWRRITMLDAVREYSGIDFKTLTIEDSYNIAKEHELEFKKDLKDCSKGEILNAMFEKYVENKLIQPTFIIDYPVEISPLTKKKRGDDDFTERFEGFIYGREICNAYSELNDPIVQRERFLKQELERELGDDEAYSIDEDFMYSLEYGMPPTGGLGIGIDRIVMFLTNSYSIRDVILFPTMKPLRND